MNKKISIILSALAILLILLVVFTNTFVVNVFSGKVHFPKKHIGKILTMENGKKFVVFRRLQIGKTIETVNGQAVFKVKFQFKSFGPSINKTLSMIPTPFLIGMEGFREKYWTIDEKSGFFQGIYRWETNEFAERYPDSFIFRLMTNRSAKGTLSYEIIPNTDLSKYIKRLSSDPKL